LQLRSGYKVGIPGLPHWICDTLSKVLFRYFTGFRIKRHPEPAEGSGKTNRRKRRVLNPKPHNKKGIFMVKTKVNFICKIRIITAQDKTLEDQYNGSFTLEDDIDSDFGGEDVFIMPEVMREAMYQLNELKNNQAGFKDSKSLDLSITDYSIEYIED
jgi:hypothetical protein